MPWFFCRKPEISLAELDRLVLQAAEECRQRICPRPRRILILPPDITRAHSQAGRIANKLYHFFSAEAEVFLMPTLGQHQPHSAEQNTFMFGDIPASHILVHDWLNGTKILGSLQADFVKKVTGGAADWPIPIELNRILFEANWDLIINIGQVVPHELLGFANHNKNYFIGLAGKASLAASHLAAACYGIENNLGSFLPPLRQCFNKAEADFLSDLPHVYFLLVLKQLADKSLKHCGFYCGTDLKTYLEAAKHSQEVNVTITPPLKKVVALMQGDEFFSTWVANKAIYRTRKALADGGELLIIAPGLKRFGEQEVVDRIIRTYGYCGTARLLKLWKEKEELQEYSHATAHLIHGSTENRFTVTYACRDLSRAEIEGVGYKYMDLDEALAKYPPAELSPGFNRLPDGEEIYFISTPALGLWTTREKYQTK